MPAQLWPAPRVETEVILKGFQGMINSNFRGREFGQLLGGADWPPLSVSVTALFPGSIVSHFNIIASK